MTKITFFAHLMGMLFKRRPGKAVVPIKEPIAGPCGDIGKPWLPARLGYALGSTGRRSVSRREIPELLIQKPRRLSGPGLSFVWSGGHRRLVHVGFGKLRQRLVGRFFFGQRF